MTSSPGSIFSRCIVISSACVQELVSSTLSIPILSSSHLLHFAVKGPSPQIL